MLSKQKEEIKNLLHSYPEIKLAYLFGSQATNNQGPLSDYDFAIYLDDVSEREMDDIKFELQGKVAQILETDQVDIVVLNLTEKPELKYNIIKNGELLVEREPYKVLIEPRILNEYFDFHQMLKRHNLTKA